MRRLWKTKSAVAPLPKQSGLPMMDGPPRSLNGSLALWPAKLLPRVKLPARRGAYVRDRFAKWKASEKTCRLHSACISEERFGCHRECYLNGVQKYFYCPRFRELGLFRLWRSLSLAHPKRPFADAAYQNCCVRAANKNPVDAAGLLQVSIASDDR
jgi:hypothetical protein